MITRRSRLQALLPLVVLYFALGACSTNPQPGSTPQPQPTAAKGANTGPPFGWMDQMEGTPKVGGTIMVRGWAADPDDGAPVQKIEVTIDDRVVALANPINLPRPDVVTVTHRQDYLNSGWGAEVRMTGVFPGKHKLAAFAYDSHGSKAELSGSKEIDVSAGQ
jgi:hypothetical protein